MTKVDTLHDLLDASDRLLEQAHAQRQPVYLVVPSHSWAESRKLQLRHRVPTGVQVVTHAHLVEQLWEVFGDGSTLVSDLDRRVLLRPLVQQVELLPSSPSPRFITQLSEFVQEAVIPGLHPVARLSESESKVMELVSLYEAKLQQQGLAEVAQVEQALLRAGACAGLRFVFENPDLHSAHIRAFIAALGQQASVSVVRQELSFAPDAPLTGDELVDLRHRLFTGAQGLQAQGRVRVGEAKGAHVASNVIVGLVQRIHQEDQVPYDGMAICLPSVASAYPRLFQELALAGIPFRASFAVLAARTGLGGAFYQAELVSSSDDEASFTALVSLASGPYGGVAGKDARALQMRWRERAHSTSPERMLDIREGFDQGNVRAADMKERLEPLARLLDAPRAERVRMLFRNAHQAHLGVDALVDDRQAAEALLDYLDACERFGCQPSADELANMPVQLARSFQAGEPSVAIVSAGSLGIEKRQAVILCGLDAANYPMASQSDAFDALMRNLGINRADTLAKDQRIMLLNTIEACQRSFAFERATHDAQGDESCQSALFDELVAAYRTQAEDEEGLPVQAVPQALQPWLLSMSEADALFAPPQGLVSQESVTRGHLDSPASVETLLLDAKGAPRLLSPTALEDYYRCPYRWFACRCVGYNGMDARFDAAAQGNLAHAVMERFYCDLAQAGHRRVTPENLPLALEIASSSFDAQVEYEKSRNKGGLHLKTKADELACEELRRSVLDLVERDATFLPGFFPTYFELELGGTAENYLEYAGLGVRGKVDRIDVDEHGNAVVIDYKLSGLSQGYGFAAGDELPKRIQTDIYATLVQRHFDARGIPVRVLGSVYRSYSSNLLRGVYDDSIDWGSGEKASAKNDALPRQDDPETYGQYLQRVEAAMSARVDRLERGLIQPDPIASDACEYCKAILFCPRGGC